MHRLLKRQIERLGLSEESAPGVELWRRMLERVSASYIQSDEARHMSERSMEISSREMRDLHDRERGNNERLEERVRERTTELEQAELAARKSEARFRSLTELSSDWYWELDRDLRFVALKGHGMFDAERDVLGRRREELPGFACGEAEWAAHLATMLERRPFRDFVFRRKNPAGGQRYVSISGEPIFDERGEFHGYRGTGRDVTESARAEQLLRLEHAVTRCLATSDSVGEAMSSVIRTVCESEGWDCGRFFRLDAAAGVLRFDSAWGVADPWVERFIARSRNISYRPGVGLSGRVWESGDPLWSSDVNSDPRTSRASRSPEGVVRNPEGVVRNPEGVIRDPEGVVRDPEGVVHHVHGTFVFPVTADGRTIGVLTFASSAIREPDDRLLQAVRVIGNQIGQYLQRKQGEEEARRFRLAMDNSAEMIVLIDRATMRFVDVNSTACRLLGYSREELLQMGPQDVLPMDPAELQRSYDQLIADPAAASVMQSHYICKDGSHLQFESMRRVLRSGDTHLIAAISRDIRERIASEERLRDQALQQRLIAEFGQHAFGSTELGEVLGRAAQLVAGTLHVEYSSVLEVQPGAQYLIYKAAVGWPAEWIGRRVVSLAPGSRLHHIVSRGTPVVSEDYRAGSEFATSALVGFGIQSGCQVPILGQHGVFGVLGAHTRKARRFSDEDVSFLRSVANILAIAIERKNAEDKLAYLAQFDTVTALPNRHLLRDRLGQALNQAQRNNWLGGVLFVDLDRFKAVNDTFGHSIGDKLLRETAGRLATCVRSGDTVARLSGDEFAVVLTTLAKADDAGLVAQKIVTALAAPFTLEGHQTYVSASVGIALYPADGGDPDVLLKNADTAMYRAKEQGRNCYQFYLPQMNDRLMERLRLEARLRGALDRREYVLHYQPKVQLDTGVISGFEALLRWKHDGGLIAPAEFIPILEDTGLIVPVGEWVLRSVCEQIVEWDRQGVAAPPIAVNISARQFQQRNLAAVVGRILQDTGVTPNRLELELTETLLMSDAEEARQTLRQLKGLGVRLAVDDFGTGYSSLAYLKRFPLDTLKIDRAFIRDAVSDPDDATLTVTIINLAHSMRLKVVAEGVETQGQLNFLRLHGCDEMQGYYFARPLEVADCTQAMVEDRRLQKPKVERIAGVPALLLVDDNEDDLALLVRALASDDFHILTATSASAGFEMLARHGADIVVSDFHMPGMSGIEFLTNVRKLYPSAVRVVTTGGGDPPTLSSAINNAGIHKFLSKNWGPDKLRAEVREAFKQRA